MQGCGREKKAFGLGLYRMATTQSVLKGRLRTFCNPFIPVFKTTKQSNLIHKSKLKQIHLQEIQDKIWIIKLNTRSKKLAWTLPANVTQTLHHWPYSGWYSSYNNKPSNSQEHETINTIKFTLMKPNIVSTG